MHVGWSTEPHGARNYFQGEYDSSAYFMLVLGLPVYWSFRGCVHVINLQKISSGERLDRVRHFANRYLVAPWVGSDICFPLRTLRLLKRLIWYEVGLILSACIAVTAVLAILAISQRPVNRWKPDDLIMVGIMCVLGAPSIPGGIAYLLARKPSQRQLRIRSVVATQLGPFSDPADWTPELIALVAQDLGISLVEPRKLLEEAEQRLKHKHHENALILARMGLALAEDSIKEDLSAEAKQRAENITDELLLLCGDS